MAGQVPCSAHSLCWYLCVQLVHEEAGGGSLLAQLPLHLVQLELKTGHLVERERGRKGRVSSWHSS